ncbi:hypothetical protein AYK24_04800 [Thermoplasmatales archaeon SG8-52-4]|nr:MAG: hypothetical protein AYK24_04800 [Thermoplasmatales archaeon SG8-52-4]
MKKQFTVFGIIILTMILLSGCNGNSNDLIRFIGEWEGVSIFQNNAINVTLTFFDDKTAKQVSEGIHAHWFNFSIKGSSLYLILQDFPEAGPIIYKYKFSNNYNSLTLSNVDIDTMILTKQ